LKKAYSVQHHATFTALPYEPKDLNSILLRMVEAEILEPSGSGEEAEYLVKAYIPKILSPLGRQERLLSVQKGVLDLLGKTYEGDFSSIREALSSEDPTIRIDAIEVLSALGNKESIEYLIQIYAGDTDQAVASLARDRLEKLYKALEENQT